VTKLVVGAYTADMGGRAEGLAVLPDGHRVATPSPSYVIASEGILYAVNEGAGRVSSYSADELSLLSTQPTGGRWPCHLAVSAGHVICANYGSGSVSVHPVAGGVIGERTDLVQHSGRGPDAERQEGAHPHQVKIADDGTVTIVDLGIDRLVHYRLDAGRLRRLGETVLPPGTGPRHYVDGPERRYVVAELGSAVLTLDGDDVVAVTPATASDVHNQPSAIGLSGGFLYLANRGADTVSTFRLSDGLPVAVAETSSGGAWPRDLAVTADGLVVANERSHHLAFFRLDAGIPVLVETLETPSPTCVLTISPDWPRRSYRSPHR
jgi:6-phosphogluconolactonase